MKINTMVILRLLVFSKLMIPQGSKQDVHTQVTMFIAKVESLIDKSTYYKTLPKLFRRVCNFMIGILPFRAFQECGKMASLNQ